MSAQTAGTTGVRDVAASPTSASTSRAVDRAARRPFSSWSGDVVVNQAVAWSSGRTAAVTRRRRQVRVAGGEPVLEQEPVVDVSFSAAGGLLTEVMRALPGPRSGSPGADRSPVRVGWPESAAIAQALRSGGEHVATHLSGLPPSALAVLGSGSAGIAGGACVSAARRLSADALGFHGAWLWTDADVVELVDARSGVIDANTPGVEVRPALPRQ